MSDDEQQPTVEVEIVPLHIAELDEAALLAMFPTPVQCAGALIMARERVLNAPAVLKQYSRTAKRAAARLKARRALAFREGREAGMSVPDANAWRDAHDDVAAAQETLDDATLAYEYAQDMRRALEKDVDLLRSLNANFRGEHS